MRAGFGKLPDTCGLAEIPMYRLLLLLVPAALFAARRAMPDGRI